MGGGKSSQSSKQSTYDNDVVAGEGAIALGNHATLDSSTNEFDTGNVESGGVAVAGEGNSLSVNNGTQLGMGAIQNNGLMLAENSEYHQTSMDDNTAAMMDSALALVGHNADNMMKLAASDTKAAQIDYATPSASQTRAQSLDTKKTATAALALLIAGLLIAVFRRGGKKK